MYQRPTFVLNIQQHVYSYCSTPSLTLFFNNKHPALMLTNSTIKLTISEIPIIPGREAIKLHHKWRWCAFYALLLVAWGVLKAQPLREEEFGS